MNLAAATGDMGILANHVPSIEALRPGVVEVVESGNSSKKFFGEPQILFKVILASFAYLSIRWFCHCTPQ